MVPKIVEFLDRWIVTLEVYVNQHPTTDLQRDVLIADEEAPIFLQVRATRRIHSSP
ncbi:MAG TPA: hypothetical protein PK156_21865 [Polyangium sp.]|nr:hypothetical protein [Polyangium sp.]